MISKEEYAGKATTLRELRLQAGKSCIEVANKLGVAVSTLYNYEQGARQIGLDKIIPLAELLCERNEMTLYKNGRAEEANKLLAQLLEEKIERHKKNAEQQ